MYENLTAFYSKIEKQK